jgi:type III pantothenate kinase
VNKHIWIGLAIGNSRYHWGWFVNTQLQSSWDTNYLDVDRIERLDLYPQDLQLELYRQQIQFNRVPIYLISVVPSQIIFWQQLPQVKQITLDDIPLFDLYPTLGIDRALAGFGAGEKYDYPVLIIDGGTALTITGIDRDRRLVGGAIVPGLRLQLNSLSTGTAALPSIKLTPQVPPRWSKNTNDAIASGIIHTIGSGIADFIHDWNQLHPNSQIIFTGGDGELLAGYLRSMLPAAIANRVICDRQLLFHGFAAIFDCL